MKRVPSRADCIAMLADEIRKRRNGCPLMLAVQVISAVVACDMTQSEVDEAERRVTSWLDLSAFWTIGTSTE